METVIVYFDEGTRKYSDKYSAAIDSLKVWYNSIKELEQIDIDMILNFKEDFETLYTSNSDIIYCGDIIRFAMVCGQCGTDLYLKTKENYGYIYMEDIPITFQYNINCAKCQLLIDVLNTYIKIKNITKEVFEEFINDLDSIINEEEPCILGCGEVIKICCK